MVKEFRLKGDPHDLVGALAEMGRPFRVAYEASTGYGVLYDRLREVADDVIVAHAGKLRLIFQTKRKNDRIDARKIATLLRLNQIPRVHVPEHAVREMRGAVEHRAGLVNKRTRAKNGVRALLRSQAIKAPKGLWTKAGREWLRSIEFASPLTAMRRDQLLEEIDSYDRMIAHMVRALDRLCDPRAALLRTVPGVGPRTAEAFLAYVDRPDRFQRTAQVGAYFGLTPRLDESASKVRYGRITREGPATVRKLLTEAAWRGKSLSPSLALMYERVRGGRKERRNQAIVALARHLAETMLAMLKSDAEWEERLAA